MPSDYKLTQVEGLLMLMSPMLVLLQMMFATVPLMHPYWLLWNPYFRLSNGFPLIADGISHLWIHVHVGLPPHCVVTQWYRHRIDLAGFPLDLAWVVKLS